MNKFFLLAIVLFLTSSIYGEAEIDFSEIPSPILFKGDDKFAYRDPAAAYHEGMFYLYFTLSENADDGGYYNMTALSRSRDLIHWTYPRIFTPRDRRLNYSSPGNVIRWGDQWILCLQTYPTPKRGRFGDSTSRIWIMRSADLENWSEPEQLLVKGPAVANEDMGRMIDPYLIEDMQHPGMWWCFYKQNGVSLSRSPNLKEWTYVGRRKAGENVTVIRDGGEYVMFHSPQNGIGVKRTKNLSDWGDDLQTLTLGQEDWPWAQGRLTAATVIDLRADPAVGKCIMFFHGSTKEGLVKQPAHGCASIGVAWSDDLVVWNWQGKK